MVAVVSGEGLGLFGAALSGAGAGLSQAGVGQGGERVYVNAATGNLVLQRRDELLLGAGRDASLIRTYNSQGRFTDDNGDNFYFSFNQRLEFNGGNLNKAGSVITRIAGDGSRTDYRYDESRGLYVSSVGEGAHDTLEFRGGTGSDAFLWTEGESGSQEVYSWQGKLSALAHRDEPGRVTISRSAAATTLTTASGEKLEIQYDGSGRAVLVKTVGADGAQRNQTYYGYDAQGRLTTVTVDLTPADNSIGDGRTFVTRYSYDGDSKRVAKMQASDGVSVSFQYQNIGGEYRVTRVTQGDGADAIVTAYAYDLAQRTATVTRVLDPATLSGLQTVLRYDERARLVELRLPQQDGTQSVRRYAYDADDNLIQSTDADGHSETYRYDAMGNLLTHTDRLGRATDYTYNAQNQTLTETTDGATQRYVYDSEHRLRYRVDAQGGVTEFRYNNQGQLTATQGYLARYDLSGLAHDQALTEGSLKTWTGAARAQGTTLTEYVYDFRGQLSRQTRYSKTDATGAGIGAATTHFIYDAEGRLLKQVNPDQAALTENASAAPESLGHRTGETLYVYDGLGRLLSVKDALGAVTTQTEYQGATILSRDAAGLQSVKTYNSAGALIDVVERDAGGVLLGKAQQYYDAQGRVIRRVDAQGAQTHYVYDGQDRVRFEIDTLGYVTENRYDALGRVTQSRRYETAYRGADVSLAALETFAGGQSAITTRRFYDAEGQVRFEIDAQGYVTGYEYDGQGRVAKKTRYDKAADLNAANLASLAAHAPSWRGDGVVQIDAGRIIKSAATGLSGGRAVANEALQQGRGALEFTVAALPTGASLGAVGFNKNPETVLTGNDYLNEVDLGVFIRDPDGAGSQGHSLMIQVNGVRTEPPSATPIKVGDRLRIEMWGADARILLQRSGQHGFTLIQTLTGVVDANANYTAQTNLYGAGAAIEAVALSGDADYHSAGVATRYVYDAKGQARFEVDAQGYVTENRYDALDRVTEKLSYSHAYAGGVFTESALQTFANGATPASHSRLVYDARGQVRFEVDALGYITEFEYDAQGRVVNKSRYAHPVDAASADLASRLPQLLNWGTDAAVSQQGGRLTRTGPASLTAGRAIAGSGLTGGEGVLEFTVDQLVNGQSLGVVGFNLNPEERLSGNDYFKEIDLGVFIRDRDGAAAEKHSVLIQYKGTQIAPATMQFVEAGDRFRIELKDGDARILLQRKGQDNYVLIHTLKDAVDATQTYVAQANLYAQGSAIGDVWMSGTATQNSERSRERVIYDAKGQARFTVDALGYVTENRYDALGRVTETSRHEVTVDVNRAWSESELVVALGQVVWRDVSSRLEVNGSGVKSLASLGDWTEGARSAQVIRGEGYVEFSAAPPQQRVIVGLNSADTMKSYQDIDYGLLFNSSGEIQIREEGVWKQDLEGVTQHPDNRYRIVMKDGRVHYYVRPAGQSEYQEAYVSERLPEADKAYFVDTSFHDAGAELRNVALTPEGIKTRYVYDAKGQARFTLDALGQVTENRYDALGRVTEKLSYSHAYTGGVFTESALQTFANGATPASHSRLVYDARGQVRFEVDALGYVTEFEYDAQGRVVNKSRYTHPVDAASADLASRLPQWLNWGTDAEVSLQGGRLTRTGPASLTAGRAIAGSGLTGGEGVLEFTVDQLVNGQSLGVVGFNLNPEERLSGNDYFKEIDLGVFIRDRDGAAAEKHSVLIQYKGTQIAPATMQFVEAGDRFRIELKDGDARILLQRKGQDNYVLIHTLKDAVDASQTYVAQANLYAQGSVIGDVWMSGDATQNSERSRERVVYDAKGQVRFTVDALGYVTENRYDALGRVTETSRHDVKVDVSRAWSESELVVGLGQVIWRDVSSHLEVNGSGVKSLASLGDWSEGARSKQVIRGEGYVEFSAAPPQQRVIVGLNSADTMKSYQDIDYGLLFNISGEIQIREEGVWKQNMEGVTQHPDNRYRIMMKDGRVHYYVRPAGQSEYQEAYVSERLPEAGKAYFVDTSFFDAGAEIRNVALTPEGVKTRYVYDAKGQARFTIDALGQVTESRYDALGRITEKLSYSHAYTGAAFTESALQTFANGATPASHSRLVYDARGQVRFEVDALGYVTEFEYDAQGRVVNKSRYAHPVDAASADLASRLPQLLNWGTDAAVSQQGGRLTRSGPASLTAGRAIAGSGLMGGEGVLEFTVDQLVNGQSLGVVGFNLNPEERLSGNDYFKEIDLGVFIRDRDGAAAEKHSVLIQYKGTQIAPATMQFVEAGDRFRIELKDGDARILLQRKGQDNYALIHTLKDAVDATQTYVAQANLYAQGSAIGDAWMSGDATQNSERSRERVVYDAKGQPRFEIDALGHVTEREYDAAGRVTATHKYLNPLSLAGLVYDEAGIESKLPIADGRHTQRTAYDARGLARFSLNALGQVTETRYDAAGRATQTLRYETAYSGADYSEAALAQFVAGETRAQHTYLVYDSLGQARFKLDHQGHITELEYDHNGQVTRTLSYVAAYDLSQPLTAAALETYVQGHASAGDRVEQIFYDARGLEIYRVDAGGHLIAQKYDHAGRLTHRVRYAASLNLGAAATLTQVTQAADAHRSAAANQHSRLVYDALGRLRYSLDGENYVSETLYNGQGQVTEERRYAAPWTQAATLSALSGLHPDAETRITRYAYDDAGRKISQSQRLMTGGAETWITESYAYDAHGNRTAVTDARGNVTTFAYDADNRLIAKLTPKDSVDDADISASARKGAVTRYQYDGFDNLIQESQYITEVSIHERTAADYATANVPANNDPVSGDRHTRYEYDALNRQERIRTPELNGVSTLTRKEYDRYGNVIALIEAEGSALERTTRYEFDDLNRVVKETKAFGTANASSTGYVYDAFGQVERVIDPRAYEILDSQSDWAKGERERLRLLAENYQANPAGLWQSQQAQWLKDNALLLSFLSREHLPEGEHRALLLQIYSKSQTFDARGLKTSETNGEGYTTYTQYDAFGNVTSVTDPNGATGYFFYDALNRQTLQVSAGGAAKDFTYNAAGQVIAQRSWANRINAASLAGKTEAQARAMLTADAAHDQLTRSDFDSLGRLKTQTAQATSAQQVVESYGYDAQGNRISWTDRGGHVYAYRYDAQGRLLETIKPSVRVTFNADASLTGERRLSDRNSYDALGNRIRVVEGGYRDADGAYKTISGQTRATEYVYDKLNREVQVWSDLIDIGFANDAGEIRRYNRVRQVTQREYDALGNQLKETVQAFQVDGANRPTTAVGAQRKQLFEYDNLNRVTAAVDAAGAVTVSGYDPSGNRILERRYGEALSNPSNGALATLLSKDTDDYRELRYTFDLNNRQVETRTRGETHFDLALSNQQLAALTQGESAVSKGFYSSAYSQEEVVTQTLYNRNGDVIAERDGRGGVTRHFYTAQGDLQATLAAGVTDYQREGGAVTVTRHHALTQWTTDALGQIREQVQYAYEAKNPAETATLAELLANVAAQRAAAESDAAKLAGRDLADLSDAEVAQKLVRGDRRQTYDYDRLGRRITETVHGVEDYQFVNGAPKKTTASSRSTRYDYDNLNRLQRTIAPGEGAETLRTLETTYDALGRKTTEKGQSFTDYKGRMARATVTYGYDALGRQVTQTRVALEAGANQTRRTLVNALGFAVADIDASGARTDYATDAFGAVAEKSWSQRQAEGGSQSYWNRYWYDGAGREIKRVDTTGLSHETRYNGYGDITAKGMNGQYQEQFKYDRLGRLFSTNKETGAPQLYLYDKNGNASAEFILVDDLKDASGNLIDLATLTSPEQVKALGVLQTQMKVSVYDERNRHTDTFEAPHDYSQLSASLTEEEVDKNWSSTVDFEEYRQRLLGTQAPQPGLTAWEDVKEETTVEYNEKNVGYYSSAPGTSSSTSPIGFDGFDLTQVESALALQYELTKVGKGLSDVALSNATNSYDSAWQAERVEKDPANENRYIKTTVRIWRAAEPVGATHNYYIYRDVQTQEFTFKPELELDAEALSSLKIEEKENSYHVLISYERGGTVTVTAPMKTTHDTKRVRLERSVVDEYVKVGGKKGEVKAIGRDVVEIEGAIDVTHAIGTYGQATAAIWKNLYKVKIPQQLRELGLPLKVDFYYGSKLVNTGVPTNISDYVEFQHNGSVGKGGIHDQTVSFKIYVPSLGGLKLFEGSYSFSLNQGRRTTRVSKPTEFGMLIIGEPNTLDSIVGSLSAPKDHGLPSKTTVTINGKEDVVYADEKYGWPTTARWNNSYTVEIPPELKRLGVPLKIKFSSSEKVEEKIVSPGQQNIVFTHVGRVERSGRNDFPGQTVGFSIYVPSISNIKVFDGVYNYSLQEGRKTGSTTSTSFVESAELGGRAIKYKERFYFTLSEGAYQLDYETRNAQGGVQNRASASVYVGMGSGNVDGYKYEFIHNYVVSKKTHTESAQTTSSENIGGSWKLESPEQRNVIQNYRVSWLLGEQSSYQIHRSQRYNAFGEIIKEVDGNGNATHMAYDAQGRLTYKVDPKVAVYQDHGPESAGDSNSSLKSLNAHPVTKYYYDGQNNLVASQDANSYLHQQKSGYSNEWKGDTAFYRGQEYAVGQVASEVDAMGAKKTYKYDQLGNKRLMIDELGRYHSFIYDKANRLQEVRQFSSLSNYLQGSSYSSERYSYDEAGNRITHTNAANFQQKYFYDGEGRITKHISFDDGDISNNSAKWERRETYYKYSYDAEIGGIGGFRKTTENGLNTETNANYRTNHLLTDDVDYFGKIRYHKDLGGHEFYYEYNQAGWLTKQTSNTAFNYSDSIIPTDTGIADRVRQRKSQKIDYRYYANGSLHQVLDEGAKSFTEFRYDANGNVVGETYRSKPFSDLAGGLENDTLPYQNVTAKYDALNRVYEIEDYDYKLNYFYDAVGNRRRVKAEYDNAAISSDKYGENKLTQDFFYLYDKENRFLVTMGALNQAANGVRTIGAGNTGYSIKYDAMGRRLSSDSAQLSENSGSPQEVRQKYGYDERGNLETIWLYDEKFKDATGANFDGGYVLISRRENIDPLGRTKKKTEYKYEKYNGNVQTFKVSEESYDYNADNRLLESKITVADSRAVDRSIKYHYLNDGQTLRQTEFKGSGDDANSVTDYFYDSQDRWDTYKESKVTITATKSGVDNWKPGTSYYAYDANGHNLFVYDHAADRSLSYVNNHNGQILFRDEVDWEEKGGKAPVRRKFFYLNGIVRGDMGSDDVPSRTDYVQHLANMPDTEHVVGQEQVTIPVGKEGHFTFNRDVKRKVGYSNLKRIVPVTSADFDQNFQPINSNYPGKAPTYYRVNSGDTLATIASRLWGDASLWYLIADANGLSGDQDLKADLNLVVPNVVTNIHNNASTFRPYDPGLALGDTTPTLPEPPPPPKKGKCAGAAIFVMIIAIAVTAIVAPAMAGVVGDALFSAGMTTVTSIGAGGATITTLTAGASAFATAAGAFVGGLAGSAVSQLAAKELDLQDHFSLRSALRGGLTAAATAGVSQYMGWGKDISWSATAGKALTAVGANYAAGKLVDQETHFRWRDVAASLATSAIMGGTGLGKTGSILHSGLEAQSWMPSPLSTPLSYSAVSGITSGVVSEAVKTAVYDSEDYRPDYVGMIAGVVGSALGRLAVDGLAGRSQRTNALEVKAEAAKNQGGNALEEKAEAAKSQSSNALEVKSETTYPKKIIYEDGRPGFLYEDGTISISLPDSPLLLVEDLPEYPTNTGGDVNKEKINTNSDGALRTLDATEPSMLQSLGAQYDYFFGGWELGTKYDYFLGAWELGKQRVLDNLDQAAIQDDGGIITFAAAFIKFPAEIGFGLIDTGLSLGGIAVSPKVRQYQVEQWESAWKDFTTTSPLIIDELATDIFSGEDDIRLTIDSDRKVINGKVVVGTDFYGVQFKNVNTTGERTQGRFNTDDVVRYASDWDGNNSTSVILEKTSKSFSLPLPKAWNNADIDLGISVGARYNLTTSQVRSAVNFKFKTPLLDFGIDWRGASHKTSNEEDFYNIFNEGEDYDNSDY
ncbi:type IV secretion protein Rhs [Hahella aquimaris]|uniref:LysM peptidoglycan-binding domain-containing protein n=2 Tax=unclassified Hahella TaxID=2624107 RepID=UPI00273CB3BD|nr:LysM peptidoglycan-binding domain-containing protein [Hahella sp. HNIBRBA332]WLQ11599.1 type IV secretion protein Rhs [Hahella sp. HNIBRBA332]